MRYYLVKIKMVLFVQGLKDKLAEKHSFDIVSWYGPREHSTGQALRTGLVQSNFHACGSQHNYIYTDQSANTTITSFWPHGWSPVTIGIAVSVCKVKPVV